LEEARALLDQHASAKPASLAAPATEPTAKAKKK
jgi:hypothetical protein